MAVGEEGGGRKERGKGRNKESQKPVERRETRLIFPE